MSLSDVCLDRYMYMSLERLVSIWVGSTEDGSGSHTKGSRNGYWESYRG